MEKKLREENKINTYVWMILAGTGVSEKHQYQTKRMCLTVFSSLPSKIVHVILEIF